MFGIGTTELLVILAVALIVIGPKKLPEIARTLGKAMGEFRRVSTDVQRTINTEIEREDVEKKSKAEEKRLAAKTKKAEDKKLDKDSDKESKAQEEQTDKAYSSAMAANNQDMDFRESEPAMKDITPGKPEAASTGANAEAPDAEPVLVADASATGAKNVVIDATPESGKDQSK